MLERPAARAVRRAPSAAVRPRVEELERRDMPAAPVPPVVARPAAAMAPYLAAAGVPGLSPAQIRRAYGIDQVVLPGGLPADGAGQTIAVVTAFDHPTIAQDLQAFSRHFGLPDPPSFVKATPQGVPSVNPIWALETALDLQWAHAIAPRANLVLVEARSGDLADLIGAVDYARRLPGVTVVSMSWGSPEFPSQTYFDNTLLTTPPERGLPGGVTFVAASGDGGAAAGPLWPSSSPNVLAVGGTTIRVEPSGAFASEIAWAGSGGGPSRYAAAPAAQTAVTGDARRTTPDVAYNAAEPSGVAVYTSVPVNGRAGWFRVAGTSAGTPQWAGLIALANQARGAAGLPPVGNAVPAVYGLPSGAFRDVVGGSNGYFAGPGYDLATGRGTPLADRVVSGLVGGSGAAPPARRVEVTPAPAPPAPRLNLGLIGGRLNQFFLRTTGRALPLATAVRLPGGASPPLEATATLPVVSRLVIGAHTT